MRLTAIFLAVLATWPAWEALTGAGADDPKPAVGIDKRIPWTKSRVEGTPEPPPPYRVQRAFPKLKIDHLIAVAHEPGSRHLLVVNQKIAWVGAGRIFRVLDSDETSKFEVLLDIDRTIYGVAFHPDFEKNGYLFVGSNGPVTKDDRDVPGQRFRPEQEKFTRVSRFTIDRKAPHACDPKSEKVIIEWKSNGHNGGDLAFGPDGMLYVTSGDGTSDSDTDITGQDLTKLLAKVLRIDVDHPDKDRPYSVPRDNPFLKVKEARPETYAYGFRNPWRIHVDRPTGDIWVGNNGQDLWETVYLVERGANYGWSLVEGSHPFYPQRQQGPTPISKPIAEHHHSEARSLTGGVVYRGKLLPDLNGAYLYGDWSTGKIWGIRHQKGKVTWHQELADSPLHISGFGLDSRGELLIVDHDGALYRLEPTPRQENPPKFPTRLSDTGLFTSVKDHRTDPGLIPYSVIAPLWSDGASKERFLALPGAAQITFKDKRGWDFPDGAVLVKTFSLGDGPARRRIETRLLVKQQAEWAGYSYLWNDDQTDAELVPRAGKDVEYSLGGGKKQVWHYPSRAECMVCHSRATNFVLGLSTLQMNRIHDYGGVHANQLETLEHINVFKGKLPKRPAALPKLVDPDDPKADLEARARSYLHANCAQCHVVAGGGNAAIDLEFNTPLDKMGLVGVRPNQAAFDLKDAQLIAPGNPEQSMLYQRMIRRGQGQMPPLASAHVDEHAGKLLRQWIDKLPAKP
ncbi:MAG: PQQ-dependent sugar dehydrogenase [Gemmataceae bacterium]